MAEFYQAYYIKVVEDRILGRQIGIASFIRLT